MESRALRIGLIGPSRRVNGTGPYVAGSLAKAGAEVVAIASCSHDTAIQAASHLRRHPHLGPEPMRSVEKLLDREDLNSVAVCSPAVFHEQHIRAAVARGLHVFCEKPLVWGPIGTLSAVTLALASLSSRSGLVLHENTQWVHTLEVFRRIHGDIVPDKVTDLEVELSPPCRDPDEMLREAFPHVASLVIQTTGGDSLEAIRVASRPGHLDVSAGIVKRGRRGSVLRVRFSHAALSPRNAAYALNGMWIRRRISGDYKIEFEANGRCYDCVDPLEQSVSVFVEEATNAMAGHPVKHAHQSVVAAAMTDAVRMALRFTLRSD